LKQNKQKIILSVYNSKIIHIFATDLKIRIIMNLDDDYKKNENDEIYSNSVRAGKRTYFFDVRSTRKGELFLTITESKKVFKEEGHFHFEKHKIFLYKEDFEKFTEGLTDVLHFINQSEDGIPVKRTDGIDYNTSESITDTED
jgi:hypothetical protein